MIQIQVEKGDSMLRRIRALTSPTRNPLFLAIRDAAGDLAELARPITHVDTGALQSSHTSTAYRTRSGVIGEVFPDPRTMNPRTGKSVKTYAIHEHNRGGEHAFYDMSVRNFGPRIESQIVSQVSRGIIHGIA